MAGEEHLHTSGNHAERTARITRCKCASSTSTPARTTTSPMAISITAPATDAATPSQLEGPRAIMPLGPSITSPGEQLRRVNADPAGDRRYAGARLQRLCHNLGFELVRPTSTKLPRRSLKTVGDRFDHMEGSSSRTRRRHRSSHRLTNSAAHSRSLTQSAGSPCRLHKAHRQTDLSPHRAPAQQAHRYPCGNRLDGWPGTPSHQGESCRMDRPG